MPNQVFVVVGTTEEIERTTDSGETKTTYSKNCVRAFSSLSEAQQFVRDSKHCNLHKDGPMEGLIRYRGGFFDLDIETVEFD